MLLVRILGIVLILVIPLLIVMSVFRPFASRQKHPRYEEYVIQKDFTKIDLIRVVEHMRQDPEFVFYFQAFPRGKLDIAIEEIYSALDQNRSQEKHLELLNNSQEQVRSLAALFQSFHFGQDMQQLLQQSPELYRTIWFFFCEELKLTVFGLCYKVIYDQSFSFNWDKETRQTAGDIRVIIQYSQKNNSWPPEIPFPVDNAVANH